MCIEISKIVLLNTDEIDLSNSATNTLALLAEHVEDAIPKMASCVVINRLL